MRQLPLTKIAMLFATCWVATTCHAASSLDKKIEATIKTTRADWGAPGIAVVVAVHDKIIYAGADGYANIESQAKASPNTVWRIASISKPVTATAIMQLVAAGKVKLDDPIWKYLPWYPHKREMVVTVRQLLTHTSGIRHYNDNEKVNQKHFNSIKDAAHIYSVDNDVLRFTPGTKYLYSSYGYALLAGIIEKASGLTYEEYIYENIFLPAGMRDSSLDFNDRIIANRSGHYRKGYYGDLQNAPYVDVSYKWAAGGVLASVIDMARFAIALDKEIILKSTAQQEAYTPYILKNGASTGYGLGWHVKKDKSNHLWVYHSGGATGGAAFLLRQPDKGLVVAIACNLEKPGNLKKLAMKIAKWV